MDDAILVGELLHFFAAAAIHRQIGVIFAPSAGPPRLQVALEGTVSDSAYPILF
ncbi:MAG TPA: hypothetical protein PKH10_01240 [bacterium]|nr:hypothetical protein [bacterium]